MRCPQCQKEVPQGARYCPYCGTRLPLGQTALPPASPIPGSEIAPSINGPCCEWHQPLDADDPDFSSLPERARPAFDPWPDAPDMGHGPYDPWCIAGFLLGLACVFLNLGLLCGAVALLVSMHGMHRARISGKSGKLMAAIGIVTAIIALVIGQDMTHMGRFGDFHLIHHWIRIGAAWLAGQVWL